MEHSTKVALDTNVLLSIEKFKVDVFDQIKSELGRVEFLVPSQVVKELLVFKEAKNRRASQAKVALEALSKRKIKEVFVKAKNADEALISLSNQAFIASNDKKLLEKVMQKNGNALSLRQKKFIKLH